VCGRSCKISMQTLGSKTVNDKSPTDKSLDRVTVFEGSVVFVLLQCVAAFELLYLNL